MTDATEREPLPGVERALTQVQAGVLTQRELMIQFLSATLIVPSGQDFSTDASAFRPVVVARKDEQFMAVFTARDLAANVANIAPFAAELTGREILAGLDPDMGLTVNPSMQFSFWLPKHTVAEIVADLLGV